MEGEVLLTGEFCSVLICGIKTANTSVKILRTCPLWQMFSLNFNFLIVYVYFALNVTLCQIFLFLMFKNKTPLLLVKYAFLILGIL